MPFYRVMSCRTGALRGQRSLRDVYTPSVGAPVGRELSFSLVNGVLSAAWFVGWHLDFE
jgi:hypothetical protein